jgi:hypothetical protein
MESHAHISGVHIMAGILASVAIFGSLHLLALTHDSRFSRAMFALGF